MSNPTPCEVFGCEMQCKHCKAKMSKPASDTTEKAVEMLRARDQLSISKYKGETMDRKDLTAVQWAKHHNEEMADGLKYGIRMEGSLVLLEQARQILGTMKDSDLSLIHI